MAKMAKMTKMEIQTVNTYLYIILYYIILCILYIFCWISATETGIQAATTTATTTGFNQQHRFPLPGWATQNRMSPGINGHLCKGTSSQNIALYATVPQF